MNQYRFGNRNPEIRDYGGKPLIVNIDRFTKLNQNYRTALWTGDHLQVTLMSIPVRGDIGLENHPDTDQFIRIESGHALVMMGNDKDNLNYRERVDGDYAVIVPAGTQYSKCRQYSAEIIFHLRTAASSFRNSPQNKSGCRGGRNALTLNNQKTGTLKRDVLIGEIIKRFVLINRFVYFAPQ